MIDVDAPRYAAIGLVAGLLTMTLLGACERAPDGSKAQPAPAPPAQVPAIRLVGTHYMTGGGRAIEARAHVSIGGVIRPTFSGARPFMFNPKCVPVEDSEAMVECAILQPIQVPAPWAFIETTLPPRDEPGDDPKGKRKRRKRDQAPKLRMLAPGAPPEDYVPETIQLPEDPTRRFFARLAPELVQRGVLTPEMVLPGGAILRTWLGVEEAAWVPSATPVAFSVSLVRKDDSPPERLFRRVVDPAGQPDQQRWIPVEIEIPDLGAEPFHLLFESLPRKEDDIRPSLPVWGDPTILRTEEKRTKPRHVVLVSLDTLRAKSMSVYGHDLKTTPLFEKMLAEGALFENAFTTFSNTLGSHMSMMTGLYPANHRVRASNLTLDLAIPTLATRMRDAGYETAAFTENALLRADAGFQRGFARYYETKNITDGAGDAEGTFRRALDWAKAQPDQPLFVFVHTYEVHAPYLPPDSTEGTLSDAELEDSLGPVASKQRALYEREIVHLDRLLADFVAELTSLAPEEELLLVITADHGEEFMEHGSVTHLQLFDEVMQIPMFMRWPGHIPSGLRIDTPVSLVDLVPTLTQFVGGDPTPSDGVSLVPLLEGAEIARDVVYAQTARSKLNGMKSRYIARSGDAKCMVRDEDDDWAECFDLATDPLEKTALAPATNSALSALHVQALDYRRRAVRDIAGEDAEKDLVADDEIDPARREKLRMLGYVE